MTERADHLASIADTALSQFSAHAKAVERVALRLPDTADRAELMWLVESLRDHEHRIRDRIAALANGSS
ncbi:hypothetical protein U1763_02555 [Sphingomonas sp. LB2R24]|uniref:hypothetical protein n=1 Tax=Sphingomonas sorbitolis TaxID=3096165 RepID=UPI002FCB136A